MILNYRNYGVTEMNRTVLVTGAGRGLGHNIVLKHLEMGDKIYAFDYQVTDELKKLADEHKDTLKIYNCNIASTESVNAAMKDVLANEKKLDNIYNVAGVSRFEDKVGLAETDLDNLNMISINSLGALRVCKAVFSLIQKGTLVLNVSSEAGSVGACRREKEYLYCMSKAALNMGAKILSNELYKTGARVMNVHPGFMRTVMGGENALKSNKSVSPEESAADIVGIALEIDNIPRDQMYMWHTRELMPW